MNYVPTHSQLPDKPLHRHIGRTALTSVKSPANAAAQWLHLGSMKLLERDYRILRLVARFGQLTTAQVRMLVFRENLSDTPCETALRRLVRADLLELVEQPHPGGRRGGRAVNVFQLGKEGWKVFFDGRRRFSRVINAHSLAIADAYVALRTAEHDGWLSVISYATEPDSHLVVAGADLRPDLYVEVGLVERGERLALWLEIDLGTERQKQIIEKIERYVYADQRADEAGLDLFPQSVVFLGIDRERVSDVRRMAKRVKNVPDDYVQVELIGDFPRSLR